MLTPTDIATKTQEKIPRKLKENIKTTSKHDFQIIKHKFIEAIFTSRISSYFSPLIKLLVSLQIANVWEGVYNCWGDAPQDDNVLEEKIWTNRLTNQALRNILAYRSGKSFFLASSTQDYILSLAGGMLLSSSEDSLCILDFGGGMGTSYFPLISSLPDTKKVEFHIVELKTICDLANKILGDFPQLHFHESLPKISREVDIIHAGSSMQYISDWKGLLDEFANYRPRILILEDILTGDIPSFITTQNFYGKKIRMRFLNINELIEKVQRLDYQLIYKSQCTQNFLGGIGGSLPMKNFPSQYQLDYGSHLIFKRIKH